MLMEGLQRRGVGGVPLRLPPAVLYQAQMPGDQLPAFVTGGQSQPSPIG